MVDTAEANMVFLCFFHQLWDQHESVRPDLLNITVPHFWEKNDGKKHGKSHESGWSPWSKEAIRERRLPMSGCFGIGASGREIMVRSG